MPQVNVISQTNNARISIYQIAHDDIVRKHYHTQVTDFILCLSGIVEICFAEHNMTLRTHQHTIIPPHTVHLVRTEQAAKYLLVQYGGLYDFIEVG